MSIIIRKAISCFFRIFFIFPIKSHVVLIDSMMGKTVSDNAKYYIDYAKSKEDDIQYVWGLQKPRSQKKIEKVTFIKYKSVKWYYYHATAKTILYSHHLYNYLPLREKQYNVFMWHAGGAYKRIGQNVAGNTSKDIALHKHRNELINNHGNIFLTSSGCFSKYNIEEVYGFHGRIEKTGMPRNDILFNLSRVKETSKIVRDVLCINENSVVVLYAPTFRKKNISNNMSIANLEMENLRRHLEKKYNKDTIILYRCHYYEKSTIATNDKIIDVSEYPDMQELLCCADILITDYSSCIWDYSILGRPCYLYVPDLVDYEQSEQGFFTPINTWPGKICHDMKELYAATDNIDLEAFSDKAHEHQRQFESYETGRACERLYNLVTTLLSD